MGRIVAFSNQKGGVGKTTTCVNMSAYLASFGKKVLLIDLDPQGNASSGLGVQKEAVRRSSYDLLCEEHLDPAEVCLPTDVPNLSVVPSNIDLAGAEVELVTTPNREYVLSNSIKALAGQYDFITIDCPPSLGLLTLNALVAADAVIIPIQCEFYALEGLSQLINTIKLVTKHRNPHLEIDGVVITMYDNRATISKQIYQEISKFFGKKLFSHVIPRNIRLSEAPSHGVPVLKYDPNCAGGKAYRRLTKEYLNLREKRR